MCPSEMKTNEGSEGCRRAEDAAAYLRHELAGREAADYEAHRKECAECRQLEADFARVIRRLEARPAATVSRDLTDSILQRISEEEAAEAMPVGRTGFGAMLLRAAAVAVAAAGLGAVIYMRQGSPALPAVATVAKPEAAEVAKAPVPPRKTEAIDGALQWLVSVQEPGGAWDPVKWGGKKEYGVSLTSMALLALRRNDRADAPADQAQSVTRAVDYLLAQQNADGSFGPECSGRMYNHGIGSVALLERLAQRDDARMREAIGRAIGFIRDQQHANGGWGYEKKATSQANTSISVWQLDALLLARKAGLADANPSLMKGLRWLRSMVDEQGTFGYQKAQDGQTEADTLTAMGTHCLFMADAQIGGQGLVNARIRSALKSMAARPDNEPDFYRSYFLASALEAGKSQEYNALLSDLQKMIMSGRIQRTENTGSWEPVGRWSTVGGRLYTTTMATLSLEEGI